MGFKPQEPVSSATKTSSQFDTEEEKDQVESERHSDRVMPEPTLQNNLLLADTSDTEETVDVNEV